MQSLGGWAPPRPPQTHSHRDRCHLSNLGVPEEGHDHSRGSLVVEQVGDSGGSPPTNGLYFMSLQMT